MPRPGAGPGPVRSPAGAPGRPRAVTLLAARRPAYGMDIRQAYETLRIAAGATLQEVKRAYQKMALKTHPDRHPGEDWPDDEFKRVNEAYRAAKDHLMAGEGGEEPGAPGGRGRRGGGGADPRARHYRQAGRAGTDRKGGGGGADPRARHYGGPRHPDGEPPYRRRTVEEILAEKPSLGSLLRCFPPGMRPRDIQVRILSEVHRHLLAGARRIVVSAPTGAGKSAVGAALAQYLETSFVVTSTRHLQDQYARDLDWLRPVKGQSNFECQGNARGEDKRPRVARQEPSLEASCYAGRHNGCELSVGIAEFCATSRTAGGPGAGAVAAAYCPYDLQRYTALRSPHSLWNYAAYLQIMHNEYEAHEPWLGRNVAIFDEAHKAEESIIDFIGLEVLRAELDECRLVAAEYDLGDLDDVVRLLNDIWGEYDRMLGEEKRRIKEEKLAQGEKRQPDLRRAAHLQKKADKYLNICDEICLDPKNFVVNDPELDEDKRFESVLIKPLSAKRHAGSVFRTPVQIFMSATIHRDSFCRSMGFPAGETAFVDTPRSPFPLESRRVDFLDVAALSYKRPENEAPVIAEIDRLLTRHAGERGLILTSSKSRCRKILERLSPANRGRIRLCHATNEDGLAQERVIDEHSRTPGSVLLSSSLWQGADLAGDKSRFQIIAKTPYLNYTEKWIRRKKEAEPAWADIHALTQVLQGIGRSVRSEEDHAITYILDSNTRSLVRKCEDVIPAAYRDALGIGG